MHPFGPDPFAGHGRRTLVSLPKARHRQRFSCGARHYYEDGMSHTAAAGAAAAEECAACRGELLVDRVGRKASRL